MRKFPLYTLLHSLLWIALVVGSAFAFADDTLTLDQVVARHLDSIGTANVRAAVKTRSSMGKFTFDIIQGGVLQANGDAGLISSGRMMKVMLRTTSPKYAGERFWYDGKKVNIPTTDVAARTYLGDFLYRNDTILRDGLFGGTISTAWPLLDLSSRGAKLAYEGVKAIDGKKLLVISYQPKKSASELQIKLFFEPDTYRHVMTQYRFEVAPYMNVSPGQKNDRTGVTNLRSPTIYTVVEKFSEFSTVDGITSPNLWELSYSVEPVSVVMMQWKIPIIRTTINPDVDLKVIFPQD